MKAQTAAVTLRVINPATGELVRGYPVHSAAEVEARLASVHAGFRSWKRTSFDERATLLRRVGALLRAQKKDLARLMATEMGKPVAQGEAEAEKCASACDYYAENAQRFLAPQDAPVGARKSYVSFQPIGVVLAIMPWNFPLWQVFRFAAPALMAGNTALLKHASNVPGCALAIERIFEEAGVPRDAFRTLLIGAADAQRLVADPRIAAVTLTGSSEAGRSVASAAGQALKKTVLELGGSDPYIVLEDADLAQAASVCAQARVVNAGQSCVAAKRFVVVDAVRERFTKLLAELMQRMRVGDPMQPSTEIGPLARLDLREQLHDQVRRSVDAGASLVLGGSLPPGRGAYYPPTILTDVREGCPAYSEELFGPVASILPASDEADAVRIANDNAYGLGASVFTQDVLRGERIARDEIEAGFCAVNAQVKSDARLPFGGVKDSGYGRELSAFGIREFVNVKTVFIA